MRTKYQRGDGVVVRCVVPPDLHHRFRIASAHEDKSMSHTAERLVREYVEASEARRSEVKRIKK
jgi:hypothetical protein